MRVRVASAGTGKTTSLVLRYLELIGSGTPPRRIAGVTFTRTAAAELRQRVGAGIRELLRSGHFLGVMELDESQRPAYEEALRELDGATLTTIHGFMIDALRLSAPAMGLDPDFAVLPEWEAQALFEEELRTLGYLAADRKHPFHGATTMLGPDAKPHLLRLFALRSSLEQFKAGNDDASQAVVRLFEASYTEFERRLGARSLPPSEVERRALKLLGVPAALARLRDRYRVALVDEFQDVNPLQGRFFEALEGAGLEVEVVGDPKQSIYGFRNADVGVFRRALANGEELPALDRSYRHGRLVNRFINHLTASLAAREMGFGPREAPEVSAAGPRAEVRGRVEVHWVAGDEPVADLRSSEADVLARRLASLHREQGIPYREMAVLARSHPSLAIAEEALRRAGLPAVLLQGRGYYERIEIRDLYNALRAGIEPSGVAFAAWLRGPFAGLAPRELEAVMSSKEPQAELERIDPQAAEAYRYLRELILRSPLEALKALIREPLIAGRSFVHLLEERQRENVDALLFTVAAQPPGDLEVLLERLELLARQTDAGDVPQAGDGVKLLTVHAAKGLEWRVAAVFDLGRRAPRNRDALRVHPDSGLVSFPGSAAFPEAGRSLAEREEAESYRLLYVAVSRPREILLLTGSVKGGQCFGWARALELMSLGPRAKQHDSRDFMLVTHPCRSPAHEPSEPPKTRAKTALEVAPWIDEKYSHHPYPPLFSPSRIESDRVTGTQASPLEDAEPVAWGDAETSGDPPGRASTIGTLVHYAISQSWSPDDPRHLVNLRAQEVMFPFTPSEQDEILAEVSTLLANYLAMLGEELPAIEAREVDQAELPMALPQGATVWQGVIDRLYQVGGRWYLDDYKTDRNVDPRLYLAQLSVYVQAVSRVRGVVPVARLVYLRSMKVVELSAEELETAFLETMARAGEPGALTRTSPVPASLTQNSHTRE
ncbi:MAG: UvrD-helicase domain-containing protein [Trueperaceae bacterium]